MVQVADFYSQILIVGGKVLRHFLCKSCYQYTLISCGSLVYLREEVVHLSCCGLDDYLRVNKSRRTYNLFNYSIGLFTLYLSRSSADVDSLMDVVIEFIEIQRTVVHSAGQTETVVHKGSLSCTVACIHCSYLRQSYMALVNDEEKVLGEMVHKGLGSASRRSACKDTGVILNA